MIQREFLAMAPLLAAGCQPGPVAVEPRPLPVASAATPPGPTPVVVVADPAGVGPGVGALVEVSERDDAYLHNTFGKTVLSGVGVFSFYTFETDWSHQGMPRCSFKSRTSQCAAFSFAPWLAGGGVDRDEGREASGGRHDAAAHRRHVVRGASVGCAPGDPWAQGQAAVRAGVWVGRY